MRSPIVLFTLLFITASASAQSANDLMDRFAAAWTQDDAELVTSMLSDDVVLVGDGDVIEGFEAVNSWGAQQMEATDRLTITSVKSDQFDRVAYHTGRWALGTADNTTGGSHTFIFERNEDNVWKIVSMTINNDPAERDN